MSLSEELVKEQHRISKLAKSYGLDSFEVIFEMVNFDQMNEVAARGGFPIRYPHWRFGMDYDRLAKSYSYGLSKIYELVINNDPCYAYLMNSNSFMDQKLVMCHVYGHGDFFKHNYTFTPTNRKMLDAMANHATRIRNYQDQYGVEPVEIFVDRCLSLENLIDPGHPFRESNNSYSQPEDEVVDDEESKEHVGKIAAKSYMDSFINPKDYIKQQRYKMEIARSEKSHFPAKTEKDILKFLMDYAPLSDWQRDVIGIIREEAYYFLPQRQTKIMNEGWASYWHSRLMTTHVLTDAEVVEYADHHSGAMYTQPGQINPYKLGIELFRDIEDRWNTGRFGKEYDECDDMRARVNWNKKTDMGREKIFEVRKMYNDVTFIDEFLTPEFAEQQKMYTYAFNRRTGQYEIVDRDFQKIKKKLLFQLTNSGQPLIELTDGNFENRNELLFTHTYDQVDLDMEKAKLTMANLYGIWSRPVHLVTQMDGVSKMLSFDGKRTNEKEI